MKLKLLERNGLPYFFRKNKRRVPFALGFLLFSVMLYILSLFVWEVKVTGENKLVADSILKKIEKDYVPLGTLKADINCMKLEEALRKEFDQISWISCELKGTGLTVYLEEGMPPQKAIDENAVGDLVASKDALITKMVTRQGTPMVKIKDTVKKGDILISGTIYIYDDNNEVMETSYIAADGDVYGTTIYPYEDFIELKYYKKIYSEKSKQHITLYFMDYCFTPYTPKMKSEKYDTYTQIHKAKIFNHFYLPFGYQMVKRTEYSLKLTEYKDTSAKKILEERLNKKIIEFKKKGVEIIKNDVKIEKVNGKLVARGNLTLSEPIAVLKKAGGNLQNGINEN